MSIHKPSISPPEEVANVLNCF